MITLIFLDISSPKQTQAKHKNSLINRFCIASIKSKLKFTNKQKLDEVTHFTCECFLRKFKSGSSIKNSRNYCRKEAAAKYNL